MRVTLYRDRAAGIIGNLLEHYDHALFGLLAPFIAPLFFERSDPVTALILTYGMLPLGLLTRPLGSLFFGWIGDSFGRRQSLFYSLLGMAFVTTGIGFLPVYQDIGIWAPLLLALGKMLQSFFAAGESMGGAIFVLEHTPPLKRGLLSSLYDASSIAGILLASSLVTYLVSQGRIEECWRFLFWAGGITAIFGLFLRWMTQEGPEFAPANRDLNVDSLRVLMKFKVPFFAILFASGFYYSIYSVVFTLMNGFIPMITSFSKTAVLQMNTVFHVVDLILLPCFGYLAQKFGKEKVMLIGAIGAAISAIPLFSALGHASFEIVIAVRMILMVFGIAFAAPYYAWAMEQVPPCHRYLILSFGGALGSLFFGAPASAICLWLYRLLDWSSAPGLYLTVTGFMAAWALIKSREADRQCCKSRPCSNRSV